MKLNKVLFLAPVAFLSMSSCAMIKHRHNITDYVINYSKAKSHVDLDDNQDFNILQLSDIHMSVMDDSKTHYQFMKKTINEAKDILKNENRNLHLIAISGDVFTFANKDTVRELCNFFEEQDVPWTLTFGNHDEQGYYSIDWLTGYLSDLSKKSDSNLLFVDYPDDDVFGSANFVINLPTDTDGQTRQVVIIDSNRYNYGEGYGYDYIHTDQIDWYRRVIEYVNTLDTSNDVLSPASLAFFHIPVPEYGDAYDEASNPKDPNNPTSTFLKSGKYVFENGGWSPRVEIERKDHRDTSEGSPHVNTHFFDAVQNYKYTKGLFVGHAHTNTNCMEYKPNAEDENSVALCYGVKATDRIYCDEEMMGGQLIRFHSKPKDNDDTKGSNWFDLDLIYHRYADLKEGE